MLYAHRRSSTVAVLIAGAQRLTTAAEAGVRMMTFMPGGGASGSTLPQQLPLSSRAVGRLTLYAHRRSSMMAVLIAGARRLTTAAKAGVRMMTSTPGGGASVSTLPQQLPLSSRAVGRLTLYAYRRSSTMAVLIAGARRLTTAAKAGVRMMTSTPGGGASVS